MKILKLIREDEDNEDFKINSVIYWRSPVRLQTANRTYRLGVQLQTAPTGLECGYKPHLPGLGKLGLPIFGFYYIFQILMEA